MLLLQVENLKLTPVADGPAIGPCLRILATACMQAISETAIRPFAAALHESRRRQAINTLHHSRHLAEPSAERGGRVSS